MLDVRYWVLGIRFSSDLKAETQNLKPKTMRCPTLNELPPPSSGKAGWPWTVENSQMPDTMPDGRQWPRISIVTPSFNQGRFIEETIRSVLLQGYPNIEYFIIDGGSTDESVDIIRRYEKWLTYWVSEPDKGPPQAIHKGLSRASGEIFAWTNSDDAFLPGAIGLGAFVLASDRDIDVVYGHRLRMDENGYHFDFDIAPQVNRLLLRIGSWIPQETAFFRKNIYHKVGGINIKERPLAMDYELFLRMLSTGAKFKCCGKFMGMFRIHNSSISVARNQSLLAEFYRYRCLYLGNKGFARLLNIIADVVLWPVSFHLCSLRKRLWVRMDRVSKDKDRGYIPSESLLPNVLFS